MGFGSSLDFLDASFDYLIASIFYYYLADWSSSFDILDGSPLAVFALLLAC